MRLAFFLVALSACNAIDGADQYTSGDAAQSSCKQSCVDTSGTCLANCASTRDACKSASGCNPGCQNKCDSTYSGCTSDCVSTCTSCGCTASACENATPADASSD
ncbi:MAG TPA: hypothetical protein VGH87_07815 [Polyangiaceae bacterium]